MANQVFIRPGASSSISSVITDQARLPANNAFTGNNTFAGTTTFAQPITVGGGQLYSDTNSYSFSNQYNNTGDYFAGFGRAAGDGNTGDYFAGFGDTAGYKNTGDYFAGFGYLAGYGNIGRYFAGFGYNAGNNNTYDNVTCLGANTSCSGASQVQVGGAGTTMYSYASATRSDERDKADVELLSASQSTAFMKHLDLVTYRWDLRDSYKIEQATRDENGVFTKMPLLKDIKRDGSRKSKRLHTGMIAQNVRKALSAAGLADSCAAVKDASFDGGDEVLSLDKDELYAIALAALKATIERVDALEAALAAKV